MLVEQGTAGSPPHGKDGEMAIAARWAAHVSQGVDTANRSDAEGEPLLFSTPCFSFLYDSKPSAQCLPQWQKASQSRVDEKGCTESTITYTDPASGLVVRLDVVQFPDFPAVEWILHFKNTGKTDTPILENILPLDTRLSSSGQAANPPVLHYAKGSLCSLDDFAPLEKVLRRGATLHLEPGGGRSSSAILPFFNLDLGAEGMILAVG